MAEETLWKQAIAPSLALFASAGTLICCALPALLVTLGMGAALAGLVTAVPQLIWLSEHKGVVFSVAGVLLFAAGMMQWRARSLPCPTDPRLARQCMIVRGVSVWIYGAAVLLFLIGAFFAFFAADLFY